MIACCLLLVLYVHMQQLTKLSNTSACSWPSSSDKAVIRQKYIRQYTLGGRGDGDMPKKLTWYIISTRLLQIWESSATQVVDGFLKYVYG